MTPSSIPTTRPWSAAPLKRHTSGAPIPFSSRVPHLTDVRLVIISEAFNTKMQSARHRMIYALLRDEMAQENGIHALQLKTLTPEEEERQKKKKEDEAAAKAAAKAEKAEKTEKAEKAEKAEKSEKATEQSDDV